MCVLACALKVKSNPCVRSSPGGKVHGEGSFRNEGEIAHQRGGGGGGDLDFGLGFDLKS